MRLTAEKVTREYLRQGKGTNVFTALSETDLVIPSGRLVEVEGRSGSGKSTLLHILSGMLEPTSGKVLLFSGDGEKTRVPSQETDLYALSDAERAKVRNRVFGIMPQTLTGLKALTVLENVILPSQMYPEKTDSEKEVRERAESLLQEVGIADLAGVYPDELSGGEMRRLSIARALINEPAFILADEPTADLDDENTQVVLTLLRKYADSGKGVFLVTHETEAAAYADAVYRMDHGELTLK